MKNTNNKTLCNRLIVVMALMLPVLFVPVSKAAENCSDQYYINETLENGAKWDMCWEHRDREGIVFHDVFYTPKDGVRREVLNYAAIAQIHVPYDDNGARYHDISDYGIGDENMLDLTAPECPSGVLLNYVTKNVLCKQTYKEQFAFKSKNNTAKRTGLSLFSVSPVGEYFYIPRWRFMDDGSIEPAIGATGALQRFGIESSRGWRMSDELIGVAHLHNFYWKLDFDLNSTAEDDVVEEINFSLSNGKRVKQITSFNTEVSRQVSPRTMRQWRVRDKNTKNANGRDISYDIFINESGHQDIGPSDEPFTQNDFYVTLEKSNEKFGSYNPSGAKNLAEFANGESLINKDIVVWPGVTFYHMPRNEDAPHMDVHWSHINIVPRNWHASNASVTEPVNTAPLITYPGSQSNKTGEYVSLSIQATDSDEDNLTYSATGLPSGLEINANTGVISGRTNTVATNTVTVNVSDTLATARTVFEWSFTAPSTSGGSGDSGGGSNALIGISLLAFIALFKFLFRRKAKLEIKALHKV